MFKKKNKIKFNLIFSKCSINWNDYDFNGINRNKTAGAYKQFNIV